MGIGKIFLFAGSVCTVGGCGIGSYLVIKKLKDKEGSKQKNLSKDNEDSESEGDDAGDGNPRSKDKGSDKEEDLGTNKVGDDVAAKNLNKEIVSQQLSQEKVEEKIFTGKLVVYIKDESKTESENLSNLLKNTYLTVLLTQEEFEAKVASKELIITDRDQGYFDFDVEKPVNREKADEFLGKLNSEIDSLTEQAEPREKFKNQLRKEENKKDFKDIFGEDLYNKILSHTFPT